MVRKNVEIHHPGTGQEVHGVEARHLLQWHIGSSTDVDEDLLSLQPLVAHLYGVRSFEATMPLIDRHVVGTLEPVLDARGRPPDDLILAGLDGFHVDAHTSVGDNTILTRPPRHVGGPRARDQRLGRSTPDVHAGASKFLPLDNRDSSSGLGKVHGKAWSRLTRPDDDRVITRRHLVPPYDGGILRAPTRLGRSWV